MTQDKQAKDQELEEYLQGNSGLAKQYQRVSAETPPKHLDDTILAASRKAVKTKPHLAFSPFASDWHVPFALAAVLVLSITLVVMVQDKDLLLEPVEDVPLDAVGQGQTDDRAFTPMPPKRSHNEAIREEKRPEANELKEAIVLQREITQSARPGKPGMVLKREQLPLASLPESEAMVARDTAAPAAPMAQRKDFDMDYDWFLNNLIADWDGQAITTPLGPVDYDIRFSRISADCVSGTADIGSRHTWKFCNAGEVLTLDFLSDFRGNDNPIAFKQLSYAAGILTFKADSHEFMEVLMSIGEENGWIKIMHYGKLHVEIRLSKIATEETREK